MNATSTAQALQLALRHHQAGRLGQAEQLYRQVLVRQPRNVDALHMLGVLAYQAGRYDAAVDLINQAVALVLSDAEAHSNLGLARARGLVEQAIAAYRRAINLKPNVAEVFDNLGKALSQQGRLEEAISAYGQSLR